MTALGVAIFSVCLFVLSVIVMNMLLWPRVRPWNGSDVPAVSVLIPARNEELRLANCLESCLNQGRVVAEVLVYDDRSTDGTAELVNKYARRDGRVRLLAGTELPGGWCGKPFACAQLAQQAASEWLLFLDADTVLATDAVASMVTEAQARDVSFLSCWPGLICLSFWERALMPMMAFSTFSLYPAPLSLVRNDPSLGLAHGACILAQREVYRSVGGHEAVRHEIFEDTCLARLWRQQGHRGICLDGQDAVHVRMYESLGEIWRGFMKNFYPAFRRGVSFVLFLLFHFVFFLLPFVMAPLAWVTGGPWQLFAASALALVAARAIIGVRFGYAFWASLFHPVAETMLIALGITSWWQCRSGRGVEWKGRRYHTGAPGEKP